MAAGRKNILSALTNTVMNPIVISLMAGLALNLSGVALPAGVPGAKSRLVLLNGNDPFIGWIGLMEWLDPKLPDPGPYPTRMGIGGHVIITQTANVDAACAAAAKVPAAAKASRRCRAVARRR